MLLHLEFHADFDKDEYLGRRDLENVVCRLVGGRECNDPASLVGGNRLSDADVQVLVNKLLEEVGASEQAAGGGGPRLHLFSFRLIQRKFKLIQHKSELI